MLAIIWKPLLILIVLLKKLVSPWEELKCMHKAIYIGMIQNKYVDLYNFCFICIMTRMCLQYNDTNQKCKKEKTVLLSIVYKISWHKDKAVDGNQCHKTAVSINSGFK